MTELGRRTFLVGTAAATATLATKTSLAAAPSRKLVLGVIGTGGMGTNHVRLLSKREDVEVRYVCDVDRNRLARAAKEVETISKKAPKAVKDLREVLDDKAIDAVFIATPDHWHTPASVLAMNADKHVYVEKPCCHNIREGRLLVETAKRTGKVVQIGTQSRSTEVIEDAMKRLHEGAIGTVRVAKAWNSQRRGSIGKSKPAKPPATLDYDLWIGPAPMVEYRPNMLPGIWRWWYDFGCGDIGNDGVHDIDVALWGLGVETHPSTATCLGGKYFFDDDQQFPDTQYAVFDYPQEGSPKGWCKQLIFEQRIWSPYVQEGYENGAAFYGDKGLLVMGHTQGWKLYGERNKLIAERKGPVQLVRHHTNFLDCVRGEQKKVNADAMAGHLSSTIVHLANISARAGGTLQFDPKKERITNNEEADALVGRKYRDGHFAGSVLFG